MQPHPSLWVPAITLTSYPTRSTPSQRPRLPQAYLFLKSYPPPTLLFLQVTPSAPVPSPALAPVAPPSLTTTHHRPRPAPHEPSTPRPTPRSRPAACQSPLLLPSGPRSTVHSSMTPKGWKSLSTSSSDCCLLSMPTNSFRSPVGGAPAHGPAKPALTPADP